MKRFCCVKKGAPANAKLFTGVVNLVEKFSEASGLHSDIKNSYLAVMNTNASSPVGFRFFAGWEKSSPMFKSAEAFRKFLQQQANLYQHPILIR